jgi:plastocyanin
MKKLFVVLAILFIGILLAGCTSQPATPAATPVPTAVPTTAAPVVITAVPTVAPTKEIIVVVVNTTVATPTPTATPVPTYVMTFTPDLTLNNGPNAVIKAGTKVVWANKDPYKPHGLTNMNGNIPYGGTYEVVYDKPGTYTYTTIFQPELSGTIFVQA